MEAQQIQTIQKVLSIVPTALPPEKLTAVLQNAVASLRIADRAQPENETIELTIDVHTSLSLVLNVFKILVEYTERERKLTPEEQGLVNELDHLIGSLAFKATRIVRGIKQFDALSNQEFLN
jgi:hypothetical protein